MASHYLVSLQSLFTCAARVSLSHSKYVTLLLKYIEWLHSALEIKKKFLNRSQRPHMDPTATCLSSMISPPLCFKHPGFLSGLWMPPAPFCHLHMFHLAYVLSLPGHRHPASWLSTFCLQNSTESLPPSQRPTSLTRSFLISTRHGTM